MTDNLMNNIEKNKDRQQTQDNNYEQKGSMGIGHVSDGEIKGTVAGTYIGKIEKFYLNPQQEDSPSSRKTEENSLWLGTIITEDHKYEGKLVCINLGFSEYGGSEQTEEIGIRLSIAFGQVEEKYQYGLGKEGSLKFGIKHGELCLSLPKGGEIPLHQRGLNQDPQNEWQINPVGEKKAPTWQFTVKDNSRVLQGIRCDEKLGNFEVLAHPCDIQAVFQVKANRNNLEITAQDVWESNINKKYKATKIAAFFKRVVEPKLKEYVSKVVLRYD